MPRRSAPVIELPEDEAQAIARDDLVRALNERWPGSVVLGSDPSLTIVRQPTGILALDWRLGGGFARNRHYELFGGSSVGKTYSALSLIAATQANDGAAAFVDVEGSFDPAFAEGIGVDLNALHLPKHVTANRVVDVVETMLRSNLYDVIVIDSIASLLAKSEADADMDAGSMGMEQAKLMSKALRKLTAANSRTTIVWINQQRANVGGGMFAKQTTTSGGRAMAFYAGTRLEFIRTENIKITRKVVNPNTGTLESKDVVRAHRVLVRVEKDKTSDQTGQETTFVMDYATKQHDPVEDLIYVGLQVGMVHKSGNMWWVEGYDDEKQNGRKRFRTMLRKQVALAEELDERIREVIAEGEQDEEVAEADES